MLDMCEKHGSLFWRIVVLLKTRVERSKDGCSRGWMGMQEASQDMILLSGVESCWHPELRDGIFIMVP